MSPPAINGPEKKTRNAAIAMGGFGVAGIGFGGFSMFVITAQKALIKIGFDKSEEIGGVTDLMGSFHSLWSFWMPLLCVVGVIWVVCGLLLGFNGIKWRPLCLLGVTVGFTWIFGYSYAAFEMLSTVSALIVEPSNTAVLPQASKGMMTLSSVFSMLMLTLIPSVVAWFLLRLKPSPVQK